MKLLYRDLLITTFFLSFATTAFPIFLPVYFSEIGLSNFQIGVSLASLYVTAAILSLVVGHVEERLSKIKILISSYFGYALLPIFYLSVTSLVPIIFARIYDGIISALGRVSRYSILETKKAYVTGVNVSLNEASSNLASFLGPIVGGIIAFYYGINMIFIIASIIVFFTALYSLKMLKFSKRKFYPKTRFSFIFKELFHDKPLIILSLVFLLFTIIDFSKFMVVTLYLKSLSFNNFSIGLIGGSFFLFTFLFEIFSGRLEKKPWRNKLLVVGLLLGSLSMFLFANGLLNLSYFLFLALLFSLGKAFIIPAVFSDLVLIEKIHPNIGTGIIIFFLHLGAAIGLISAGILTQISFNLFFMFGSSLLLISSVISLLYLKIR